MIGKWAGHPVTGKWAGHPVTGKWAGHSGYWEVGWSFP